MTSSIRRWSTAPSTASASFPRRAASSSARPKPAGCSSTPLCSSVPSSSSAPLWSPSPNHGSLRPILDLRSRAPADRQGRIGSAPYRSIVGQTCGHPWPRQGSFLQMNGFDHWALTVAIFLPMAGALVLMVLPRDNEGLIKGTALLTALLTLADGVYVLAQFDYDRSKA